MRKFHYVYHTTIKSNRSGKIYHYVGKRTTTNLDDGYVGSGKVIKMMKRKNKESETPIYEFEVVRSKLFDTAEEAFECEILLVEAAREKWGVVYVLILLLVVSVVLMVVNITHCTERNISQKQSRNLERTTQVKETRCLDG